MVTEIKPIPGYNGYSISKNGDIWSDISNKFLSPTIGSTGYMHVVLYRNKKKTTHRIHVLVAMTFLGHNPCGYKKVVDHIDNDKLNNSLENLQVITHRHNSVKDKKNGSSKYNGVSWNKNQQKWKSSIVIENKRIHLGYFSNDKDAYFEYKKALDIISKGDKLEINDFIKNVKSKFSTSSKYKGVCWNKSKSKFQAQIKIGRKNIYLGLFDDELEASEAYNKARLELGK